MHPLAIKIERKIFQMDIKNINISQSKASKKNYPNSDFWFKKITGLATLVQRALC
jgi:hypothetical protein